MATIQKRKKKNGSFSYRVMIRQSDGFPTAYKTFPTRQEAKDWAQQEEARRRQGTYLSHRTIERKTMSDLIDRYLTIVLPTKPKNARDTRRHLLWWRDKLGKYAVKNVTPDLIATCRQELANGITPKGNIRSPPTVNRSLPGCAICRYDLWRQGVRLVAGQCVPSSHEIQRATRKRSDSI